MECVRLWIASNIHNDLISLSHPSVLSGASPHACVLPSRLNFCLSLYLTLQSVAPSLFLSPMLRSHAVSILDPRDSGQHILIFHQKMAHWANPSSTSPVFVCVCVFVPCPGYPVLGH